MKILVTGAKGFVGKNLVCALNNIKEKKDNTHNDIVIEEVFEYDIDSTKEDLINYCSQCDFVFNFAGVNRPTNSDDFMKGNCDFITLLIDSLNKVRNKVPIMLSSSLQATLIGRYNGEYGKSKKAGEELLLLYSQKNNCKVYIYRFPNLFGKWCRPNYNSVIATFCYNIANDLPIKVNDPNTQLELLYIDDLISEMLNILSDKGHRCNYDGLLPVDNELGQYYYVPRTHTATLGEIVDWLVLFNNQRNTLVIPELPKDSFQKKLYSTFLSYLPKDKVKYPLKMNRDFRGSFTELIKTEHCGQFSVNISKPNVVKGQHWHNSKWEFFIVVSGHALIQERKIGTDEILEFDVSGEKIEVVHMLPGYTHNIINLSDKEDLVTVMWANEQFDQCHPDTFREEV